jgi:DNA-binding response OmpR family regulator
MGIRISRDASTVTVHIARIREKIEVDPASPQYIETVWGAGYRFKV